LEVKFLKANPSVYCQEPLPKATRKKEYSGKFLLRTGKDFHKILSIKTLQAEER